MAYVIVDRRQGPLGLAESDAGQPVAQSLALLALALALGMVSELETEDR